MEERQELPLKTFRVNDERIEELKKNEKVDILIYLSLASNFYILDILAGLSRVLKKLADDNGLIKGTVKIKFLVMLEISRKVDLIKAPLIEHNEYLIDGLKKENGEVDEEKFSSLIEFRHKEFQSLINSVLRGLTHVRKIKDIVLKNTGYEDIEKYMEKKNIRVSRAGYDRIKKFRESIREVQYNENGVQKVHELTKFTKDITLHEEHPVFDELLKIIAHYSTKKRKLILVVSDVMEALIMEALIKKVIVSSKNIYFCVYPTLLFGPSELFKGDTPYPGYYTILSQAINEKPKYKSFKKKIDELWFSEMLSSSKSDSEKLENLNSRVFKDKIKEIATESSAYNAIDFSNPLPQDKRFIPYYEKAQQKYRDALDETIRTGFLTIQKDLISQLKLIL